MNKQITVQRLEDILPVFTVDVVTWPFNREIETIIKQVNTLNLEKSKHQLKIQYDMSCGQIQLLDSSDKDKESKFSQITAVYNKYMDIFENWQLYGKEQILTITEQYAKTWENLLGNWRISLYNKNKTIQKRVKPLITCKINFEIKEDAEKVVQEVNKIIFEMF